MTQPAHTAIDVAALLSDLQRRIHTNTTQSGSTSALTREELRVLLGRIVVFFGIRRR